MYIYTLGLQKDLLSITKMIYFFKFASILNINTFDFKHVGCQ